MNLSNAAVVHASAGHIYAATLYVDGRPYMVTDQPMVIPFRGGTMTVRLPEPLRSAYRRQRLESIGVREIHPENP